MLKIEFAPDQFFDAIAHNAMTLERLSDLVSQGHSLEALTENGDTVFHVAAQRGATQSLVAIIDYMKARAVVEKTSKTPWGWLTNKYYSDDPDLPPLALALLKTTNKQGATPIALGRYGWF